MTNSVTKESFFDRLDDITAGMLSIDSNRPVPMSHYVDRDAEVLWFITARGTGVEEGLRGGPQTARHIVGSQDGQLYATIDGLATLVEDPAKLDELWNPMAAAWFEDGREDEDIALVRFDLNDAEVWETGGSLRFLFEIAKANASEKLPDTGAHGRLRFAA